ncbi:MAG: hypothetical protein Q7S37_00425 [bacterium]|nr:hypothetical protein [bacterium]
MTLSANSTSNLTRALLLMSFLFGIFALPKPILAAPVPTTPRCGLEAMITNLSIEITKPDGISYEGGETQYFPTIKITKTSKVGDTIKGAPKTCEEAFPIGKIIETSIIKERDLNQGNELKVGQVIGFTGYMRIDEFSKEPGLIIDTNPSNSESVRIIKDVGIDEDNDGNGETQTNKALYYLLIIPLAFLIFAGYFIIKRHKTKVDSSVKNEETKLD